MILNIFGIKILIENMATEFTVGMYKISERLLQKQDFRD